MLPPYGQNDPETPCTAGLRPRARWRRRRRKRRRASRAEEDGAEGEGDKEAERVEIEAKWRWRWRWLVGLLLLLLEPKAKATKPTGPKSQEPAPPPSLLKALAYSTFDTLFRIYLSNIFPLLSLTIQI